MIRTVYKFVSKFDEFEFDFDLKIYKVKLFFIKK